eukprot:6457736-Amphidinium_carterae.1
MKENPDYEQAKASKDKGQLSSIRKQWVDKKFAEQTGKFHSDAWESQTKTKKGDYLTEHELIIRYGDDVARNIMLNTTDKEYDPEKMCLTYLTKCKQQQTEEGQRRGYAQEARFCPCDTTPQPRQEREGKQALEERAHSSEGKKPVTPAKVGAHSSEGKKRVPETGSSEGKKKKPKLLREPTLHLESESMSNRLSSRFIGMSSHSVHVSLLYSLQRTGADLRDEGIQGSLCGSSLMFEQPAADYLHIRALGKLKAAWLQALASSSLVESMPELTYGGGAVRTTLMPLLEDCIGGSSLIFIIFASIQVTCGTCVEDVKQATSDLANAMKEDGDMTIVLSTNSYKSSLTDKYSDRDLIELISAKLALYSPMVSGCEKAISKMVEIKTVLTNRYVTLLRVLLSRCDSAWSLAQLSRCDELGVKRAQ